MEADGKTFVSLIKAAGTLGLPVAWLRREAREGHIPCLRAGRQFLFNIETIREELLSRCAPEQGGGNG
jgi:hypothetical protein